MYNIAITGNLAHDLEVRGDAENPQVFFTLIRNEPVRGSDETKPVRYPIGVFGQQAKNFAASARKGDRITAVVRLGNRQQEVAEITRAPKIMARDLGYGQHHAQREALRRQRVLPGGPVRCSGSC